MIQMTALTGPPNVTWQLHPDDVGKIDDAEGARGLTETNSIELSDANGHREPFAPILDQQLKEESTSVPPGGEGIVGRTVQVSEPMRRVLCRQADEHIPQTQERPKPAPAFGLRA